MTARLHASPPVHFALLRRAVWLWLAVLLAVFGALGSTVSHALASNRTPVGMEICTSMGMQWMDASQASDASSEQPLSDMRVDCPMCLLCADRLGTRARTVALEPATGCAGRCSAAVLYAGGRTCGRPGHCAAAARPACALLNYLFHSCLRS